EKPAHPVSNLTNAGMYAFHPCVLNEVRDKRPSDIGYDLLPALVGRARAVLVEGYFRDIGTAEAYQRAREEGPARAWRGSSPRHHWESACWEEGPTCPATTGRTAAASSTARSTSTSMPS